MTNLFSLENKAARRIWLAVFFACFIVELWMVSWSLHNKVRHLLNPICWLTAGVVSAAVGGWLSARFPPDSVGNGKKVNKSPVFKRYFVWAIAIFGAIIGGFYLQKVYRDISEFTTMTDILIGKREYIRRFFAGEIVYRPIPFAGWDLAATYLPTRWLPFIFADIFKFDYRWVSYFGLLAGLSVWVRSIAKNPNFSAPECFLKTAIAFAVVPILAVNDPHSLGLAVELLMVGYYLLLSKNMTARQPFALGFCLLLCLLSRYSLVVWCPVLAFVLFFEKGWKYVAAVSFWVILGIFCLYLLPFCRHDMGKNFVEAYDYYIWACFQGWSLYDWEAPGAIPFTHARGIGFSFFFYKYAPGGLREKYDLMLRCGTILSLAVTAGGIVFYWIKIRGKRPAAVEPFLLASLKIFMLVFTGFIVLPFSYLFAVPLFLTVPLLFRLPLARIWGV